MTDIVEQAARKVFEHQIPLASDKPRDFDDPKFLYERNKAFDTAQDLADAGLLVDTNTHTNSPDTENPQQQAENIVARTVPTREEISKTLFLHKATDNAAPTVPEIGALCDSAADAVLALLAGQPTVAEVQAQALEEAAEIVEAHRQQRRESIGPIDENTMDPLLVQAHDSGSTALMAAKSLILARAQQYRDGK